MQAKSFDERGFTHPGRAREPDPPSDGTLPPQTFEKLPGRRPVVLAGRLDQRYRLRKRPAYQRAFDINYRTRPEISPFKDLD